MKGASVRYIQTGQVATIVKVHTDVIPPYYTIAFQKANNNSNSRGCSHTTAASLALISSSSDVVCLLFFPLFTSPDLKHVHLT